jgi:hypothetical protein
MYIYLFLLKLVNKNSPTMGFKDSLRNWWTALQERLETAVVHVFDVPNTENTLMQYVI